MIFAVIDNNRYLFDTWEQCHKATFSPETVAEFVTDFRISGKDYNSKKAAARDLAAEIQRNDCGGLTWSEYMTVAAILEKVGKRYGLLTEYRENGIL